MSFRRMKGVLLLAALAIVALPATATIVAGIELPARLEVAGQRLELASCGVRDTLWIDHYVAALYLPAGADPAAAMSDAAQAKLVMLQIIGVRLLPEEIPARWRAALRDELARDALALVRAAYRDLRAGDRVEVRYAPDQGVSMAVNGRVVAHDASDGVFEAMLRAWAEGDPISGKLHRLLLRNPC